MEDWLDAQIYHYATSYTTAGFGPEFPEPRWAAEEWIPCPVCNRTVGCRCYPAGWDAAEAAYLEWWGEQVTLGLVEAPVDEAVTA